MKKTLLTLIAVVTLTACSEKETIIINNEIVAVQLNTKINLSSDVEAIFSKQTLECEFTKKYDHKLPELFNVYFISMNGGENYEFNNVKEGNKTYKIKRDNYRIVVTNSNKKYLGELPVYSTKLYLFGETTANYLINDNANIEVKNTYASVMVVNNDAITTTPMLDGQKMANVGDYYNLYIRKKGKSYLGINNDTKQVNKEFKANKVYRYILCQQGSLNIGVDEDILEETEDTKL